MGLPKEVRDRILREREALMREAVASARTQPKSSKDVLSEKQRAHVKKISEQLAKGENPYDVIGDKGQVGGSVVDKPTERPAKERSEEQIKALEAKWATKFDKDLLPVELEDLDLGAPSKKHLPGVHYCSFCDREVAEVELTQGVKVSKDGAVYLRKSISTVISQLPNGQRTFEHLVKHFPVKLKACPDHALFIKKVDLKREEGEG